MEHLGCYDNQITSLNISSCTNLTYLWCHNNQLTNLDVSGCTALGHLGCYDNQITSLNMSSCTNLTHLWCHNNQLTNLDISGCVALQELLCYNNRLPLSELYSVSTVIATQNNKQFGFQQLSPVAATVGVIVDWSPLPAQNIFNGNYTAYDVRTGSNYTDPLASTSDYTITNGNITFNTDGIYTVIMNNAAVECNASPVLQVVATITVICDPAHVPVTGINGIPSCTSVGNMSLIGIITPTNATNQDIIWTVTGAGASISGTNNDILSTTLIGSVTVTAIISNGLCGSDYIQDFNINVLEAVTDVTYTPEIASTGSPFTLGVGLSVIPSTITDYIIAWKVINAGTTGAKISGNTLKATSAGTVTVREYIIHNACGYVMFTKDYSITVNDGCCN